MATQFFYIEGIVNWAKVQEPVLKYGSETDYEWTLNFKPFNKAELKASGSRKKEKDDGFFALSRNTIRNSADGEIEETPPTVLLKNHETGENEVYTGLIGNGSKAIVKIAVYDTRMGKGTRLEGLVVTELVPYEAGIPSDPITTTDGDTVLPF